MQITSHNYGNSVLPMLKTLADARGRITVADKRGKRYIVTPKTAQKHAWAIACANQC